MTDDRVKKVAEALGYGPGFDRKTYELVIPTPSKFVAAHDILCAPLLARIEALETWTERGP